MMSVSEGMFPEISRTIHNIATKDNEKFFTISSDMSAYYQMGLESFAIAPKRGGRDFSHNMNIYWNFIEDVTQGALPLGQTSTLVEIKCFGTLAFLWARWTTLLQFKPRSIL